MRLVFMGTPDFAVPSLKALVEAGHQVVGVATQPDRPSGRGMKLTPSPVKTEAVKLGLPVMQPEKVSASDFVETLRGMQPDVLAVVAFGQLIPSVLLDLPRFGCVNVHPSLLPEYRGATPIQAAILDGKTKTGVTTMYLDKGLDTGDIILQEQVPIAPTDNAGDLHDKLAVVGADLLRETLRRLASGSAPRIPQDSAQASYCQKIKKEEGLLDWEQSAADVANRVRAFSPWPGAFTYQNGTRLKVLQVTPATEPRSSNATPGEILAVESDDLVIAAGSGAVRVQKVQPANGKRMTGAAFARGRHLALGDKFAQREE